MVHVSAHVRACERKSKRDRGLCDLVGAYETRVLSAHVCEMDALVGNV